MTPVENTAFLDGASVPTIFAETDGSSSVIIDKALLIEILRAAMATVKFDEKSYLQQYPDVKAAVVDGNTPSGLEHFVGYGFFEGRSAFSAPTKSGFSFSAMFASARTTAQRAEQREWLAQASDRCFPA